MSPDLEIFYVCTYMPIPCGCVQMHLEPYSLFLTVLQSFVKLYTLIVVMDSSSY